MVFPVCKVRVRDRDGTSEKKRHGPVRGLEDLGELLVDREGHPELEPAEQRRQGEGRAGRGLPFGSPASEGQGGRQQSPSMPSSAPAAPSTLSRLMAITPRSAATPAMAQEVHNPPEPHPPAQKNGQH